MNLKRYCRATLRDELRAVREELGPDALVLSTREVTAPGVRGFIGRREIEVTAAAERPMVPDTRHPDHETIGAAPPQTVPADLSRVTAPVLADWIMGEMVKGAVA